MGRFIEGEGQRDKRTPGVADDNRTLNTEPGKSLREQSRLPCGGPFAISRTLAVPEAGPIEGDDAEVA